MDKHAGYYCPGMIQKAGSLQSEKADKKTTVYHRTDEEYNIYNYQYPYRVKLESLVASVSHFQNLCLFS